MKRFLLIWLGVALYTFAFYTMGWMFGYSAKVEGLSLVKGAEPFVATVKVDAIFDDHSNGNVLLQPVDYAVLDMTNMLILHIVWKTQEGFIQPVKYVIQPTRTHETKTNQHAPAED